MGDFFVLPANERGRFMKYLQTLCEQANVSLELKYYMIYLNALEEALLKEAVKKNSSLYALSLLKAFSLKILFLLQHSSFLWGESQWQLLLSKSQAMLTATGDNDHLRRALQMADDVISTANITETVRKKIWRGVESNTVLSDLQAKNYESARQACLKGQTGLNMLKCAVNTALHDYYQLIEHVPLLNKSIPSVRPHSPEFSQSLRSYDVKMNQMRLSTENIHHQVQCEGDARIVYKNLSRELGQKPVVEKMAEAVEKAKISLQRQAEAITEKTNYYHRQINQQIRCAIEHRTQVILAHANRAEQIALLLAALIHTAQSHCASHCEPLLNLTTEAKAMQQDLQENKSGVTLKEKLLVMNTHLCAYEKSTTSFWGALFTNSRQLQYQQQLHHNLQIALANLVAPICGFDDKDKAIPPDTIRKLKITSDKLAVHQGHLVQEQEKINQIKNIFSA